MPRASRRQSWVIGLGCFARGTDHRLFGAVLEGILSPPMPDDSPILPSPEDSVVRRQDGSGFSASPLSPLRSNVFRAVWFASLASNFGGLIQSVGASWMMTSIANSANMVALVQASTTLPIMLFSLAAGAIADNYDRRKVMLAAQIFLLVVSVGLAASTYMGL